MRIISHLVLKHVVPGLAGQSKSDDELEDIEREVGNDAVNPDHSCPSPPNAMDPGKAPVCIHSNDSGNLIWTGNTIRTIYGNHAHKSSKNKFNTITNKNTNQLCCNEGNAKQETRAFNKGPAPWSGHKDECLTNNAHLKVKGRVKLCIIISNCLHSKNFLQQLYY